MTGQVQGLPFPESIGLYGRDSLTGAVTLNLSRRLDGFMAVSWGRIDSPGAGLEPGYYFVRARSRANVPTGWWASIELYRVEGTLRADADRKGTSNRHFTDLGEFEGAADFETATRLQRLLEASRRERGETL
jgi:hypothetical protein